MRLALVVSIVAALSLANGASAQRVEHLQQGMRVRVVPVSGQKVIGTLVTGDRDSLTIASETEPNVPFTIAQESLRRLDVDMGPRRLRGAALGGLMGLGIGAAAGAVLGLVTYSKPQPKQCTPDPEAWGFNCAFANACFMVCSASEAAAILGILGGGAGLVSGIVAGAVHGRHSWVKVPLPLSHPPAQSPRASSDSSGARQSVQEMHRN